METDEFLEHFGVKGMHWGVRKDPSQSTEGRSARAASSSAFLAKAADAQSRHAARGRLTEDEYAQLSSAKEFVAANSSLVRITKNPADIAQGRSYVSHLLEDVATYKALIPVPDAAESRGGQKSYDKTYEVELQAIRRLVGPSQKARVDILKDVISKPLIDDGGKKITGRQYLENAGFGSQIKSLSDHDIAVQLYKTFTATAGKKNDPVNTAYYNRAKALGYDVISDDNDRGVLAKAPLIILKPGAVRVASTRQLSADEINKAQRQLKPGV